MVQVQFIQIKDIINRLSKNTITICNAHVTLKLTSEAQVRKQNLDSAEVKCVDHTYRILWFQGCHLRNQIWSRINYQIVLEYFTYLKFQGIS